METHERTNYKEIHLDFASYLQEFVNKHNLKTVEILDFLVGFLVFSAGHSPDKSTFYKFLPGFFEANHKFWFNQKVEIKIDFKEL